MLVEFEDIGILAARTGYAIGPPDFSEHLTAFVVAVKFVNEGYEVFHGSQISYEKEVAGRCP